MWNSTSTLIHTAASLNREISGKTLLQLHSFGNVICGYSQSQPWIIIIPDCIERKHAVIVIEGCTLNVRLYQNCNGLIYRKIIFHDCHAVQYSFEMRHHVNYNPPYPTSSPSESSSPTSSSIYLQWFIFCSKFYIFVDNSISSKIDFVVCSEAYISDNVHILLQ